MIGKGIFPRTGVFQFLRKYSEKAVIRSYFELFPKTFPNKGFPKDSFIINSKVLRHEYRLLQSQHHPDIVMGSIQLNKDSPSDSGYSAILNKAYTTLKNPYNRIAHIIEVNHPDHLDITQDEISKKLIANFQSSSTESSLEYKEMLMNVMEAHESLEMADLESDLDDLSVENDERISSTEENIDKLLKADPIDWESVMMDAIKLKYWVNIQNGIKDWEPGKPVHLTH